MEEKFKKESKFVDNVAYKNKFQFLIWVNNNVICQRYFKINGFNEESIYSAEFNECMNGIVDSIQRDLESKSRIFMWYTNMSEPMKIQGFLTEDEDNININNEIEKPKEGEFIFKFSFLIDDVPVFEKIWDGNVYPKFVRNGVDLTNNYAFYDNKDTSALSFGAAIIRYMQKGKINLISDFIRRICETLSNSFSDEYVYTKEMTPFKTNNKINKEKYEAAVAYYGGPIKPIVTGHTDIKEETKVYNYLSAFEAAKQSWKKSVRKKTQEYFDNMYPSKRQIDYIEKNY